MSIVHTFSAQLRLNYRERKSPMSQFGIAADRFSANSHLISDSFHAQPVDAFKVWNSAGIFEGNLIIYKQQCHHGYRDEARGATELCDRQPDDRHRLDHDCTHRPFCVYLVHLCPTTQIAAQPPSHLRMAYVRLVVAHLHRGRLSL